MGLKPIEINFTQNPFDQWRVGQVGASIVINKRGVPVIRFKDRTQLNKYLALNRLRKERGELLG
jgi:hypothetical protein